MILQHVYICILKINIVVAVKRKQPAEVIKAVNSIIQKRG